MKKILKSAARIPAKIHFKKFEIDNDFSVEKFGKCPLHLTQKTVDSSIKNSIMVNPNQEWEGSPIEVMKEALYQLTGAQDLDVAHEIIDRAVTAMPLTHGKEHNTNVVYQSLTNAEVKDTLEAKLCAQSSTLYAQGMHYLSRAEKTELLYQAEYFMKCAIKLLRLHNETIETLARYRRKGEQRVVVQHVNVNDGGKAIVSNLIS